MQLAVECFSRDVDGNPLPVMLVEDRDEFGRLFIDAQKPYILQIQMDGQLSKILFPLGVRIGEMPLFLLASSFASQRIRIVIIPTNERYIPDVYSYSRQAAGFNQRYFVQTRNFGEVATIVDISEKLQHIQHQLFIVRKIGNFYCIRAPKSASTDLSCLGDRELTFARSMFLRSDSNAPVLV